MRSLYLLFFFLLSLSTTLSAKDDYMLVFSVMGKSKYMENSSSKSKRLKANTKLFPEATIKLKKKSKVNLYYNGEYQILEGPGNFSIDNLMKETESRIKDSFAKMMAEDYLMASTDGKGSGKKKGSIGFGNEKYLILPIAPAADDKEPVKLNDADIKFEWKNREEVAPSNNTFQLMITGPGDKEVYQTEVKGFSHTVSASTLGLSIGLTYGWRVKSVTNDTIMSPKVLFEYVAPADQAEILAEIQRRPIYRASSPAAQLFFQAVYLEEEDYHYAAYQLYLLGRKKYKKDDMLEQAYQRYLQRHGLMPE